MLTPVSPATVKRYRIGEVAKRLGVEPYVLRFWEEEFPQLTASRTEKGQRYYTEEHLELLEKIKDLLYVEKLTIKGARQRLVDTPPREISLDSIRRELLTIKTLLEKP